jgi:hypothetical protein
MLNLMDLFKLRIQWAGFKYKFCNKGALWHYTVREPWVAADEKLPACLLTHQEVALLGHSIHPTR